ncbi:MAG: S28 family serine protease [Bacteroidales bacterium]|nr:S28 family serine protease [Bacteroidales bacterium]
MKFTHLNLRFALSVTVLCLSIFFSSLFAQDIKDYQAPQKILSLNGVSISDTLESEHFTEKYVLQFDQTLDYSNPESSTFKQRVILCHRGFDKPVIFVTEGYGASYALSSRYTEELAEMFDANIVFAEYRYFLESRPENESWDYLTAENAVQDLHSINTKLKELYNGKWITTGVSKGGQTTIYYRAFYPDDVDVSVPYVGPICFGVEDKRLSDYLDHIGSKKDQKKIRSFQKEMLKKRDLFLPDFEKYCKEKEYQFADSYSAIYDYCVLEYRFSIWQWGSSLDMIPSKSSSDKEKFDHFIAIADPSYFNIAGAAIDPFFYQAAKELGYYGYDTKHFKKLLSIKSSKDYLRHIFPPTDILPKVEFDDRLGKKVVDYIKNNDPKMICIYGEIDPWSGAALQKKQIKGKKNMFIYFQPNGSHLSRINNMPDDIKKRITDKLNEWIN